MTEVAFQRQTEIEERVGLSLDGPEIKAAQVGRQAPEDWSDQDALAALVFTGITASAEERVFDINLVAHGIALTIRDEGFVRTPAE